MKKLLLFFPFFWSCEDEKLKPLEVHFISPKKQDCRIRTYNDYNNSLILNEFRTFQKGDNVRKFSKYVRIECSCSGETKVHFTENTDSFFYL